MDFTSTVEQRVLADAVRGILGRDGSPAAEDGRSAAPPPQDTKLWEGLVEVGVPGLAWAEEDGGAGAGIVDLVSAAIEIGRARLQVPLAESVAAGVLLTRLAAPDLRAEILGGLSEGTALPIPALAEPLRAWSLYPVDVTARGEGDAWTLTGTKAPVRYAPAATHLLVTAATGSGTDVGTGIFLVTDPSVDGETCTFTDTPATLLASGDDADRALRRALAVGGVVLCGEAVGAMDEALRLTTEYLNTRTQFGRPLAAFQTLTQRAADMYAQLELARSVTLFAAMVADEEPVDEDAILRARVVVNKAAKLIGFESIQMYGGNGVSAEYAVGHLVSRLVAITRTWGDTHSHLADLGSRVGERTDLEVLV